MQSDLFGILVAALAATGIFNILLAVTDGTASVLESMLLFSPPPDVAALGDGARAAV